jgi:ATP-binding cassette subfamily B protein
MQAEARAASGRLAAAAADLLRNVRAIQAFGRGGYAGAQFRDRSGALRDANVRALVTDARFAPLADVTLAVGSGLVLLVGGHEVLAGRLAVGGLVVVTSYLSALYSPVRGLSRLSGVLAKAGASASRLDEVLASRDRVVDAPDARPAPRIIESVRFSDVRFGYQPERPVLDGLDLTVRAGETICLFGHSGVGKSTVLHLLLRLYDVDAGAVLLDGVDVRDVDRASLRRRIAFVPQEPWLLDTTIAANIAFGTERATRHAIQRAGHDALVDEFTDRLPRGYLTEVGEGASRLSGGQRRRIALARAAISDAPLVLLDEPTTGLDPVSATAVAQAIRRSTEGRTVIVVTHDQMLAEYADRVVTLTRRDVAGLRVSDSTVRKEVFQ